MTSGIARGGGFVKRFMHPRTLLVLGVPAALLQ